MEVLILFMQISQPSVSLEDGKLQTSIFSSRLFILVEALRLLAYQPPEAFRNTWAANVPHVA